MLRPKVSNWGYRSGGKSIKRFCTMGQGVYSFTGLLQVYLLFASVLRERGKKRFSLFPAFTEKGIKPFPESKTNCLHYFWICPFYNPC